MHKRLYRSRADRMIFGVCGGIANYFETDPTLIRVIAILLTVLTGGAAILAYLVLAVVVPVESSTSTEPKDVVRENVEEIKQTATQFGEEMRSTFGRHEGEPIDMSRNRMRHGGYLIAIILIIVGLIFLLGNFVVWLTWRYLWPVILIAIGLLIIFRGRRK